MIIQNMNVKHASHEIFKHFLWIIMHAVRALILVIKLELDIKKVLNIECLFKVTHSLDLTLKESVPKFTLIRILLCMLV